MAASEPTNTTSLDSLRDSLPKELWFGDTLYLYQGFWCFGVLFDPTVAFQTHFEAHDTDIILASLPKTGTTWLKSLLYTIVNRQNLPTISQHILHSKNPHELIQHFELEVYRYDHNRPDLADIPPPRLFATHVPYPSLPDSIKTSKCRIVYVSRNPLDTFVSLWHFFLQFDRIKGTEANAELMEEHLSKYCKGICPFGPHEDHLLGYWKETQKNPQKVLFLEYEGLKKDPKGHLKKLAEFVGYPFSKEEEENNVIDDIIDICSLKSLKDMEINKTGHVFPEVENKFLFRKGEVGNWTNDLTPSMAKQFDQMLKKIKDAGFCSTYYPMDV
ncbi:Cytosolic sulfotransferase 15 [Bienertia sinuspersici]